jgi:hypothetical protein
VTIVPDDYSVRFKQSITPILNDKRWYMIPASHSAFVPESSIISKIKKDYPEINSVTVTHKGVQGLEVTGTLRTPLFRLDNGLAIDTDGIVYQEPKDTSKLALMTVKVTLPSKATLAGIASFAKKVETTLKKVSSITIDENSDVIYYLENSPNKSYITTSLKDDTETLWSTFVSAITTEPLATSIEQSKDSLLYVDLRFGNKVFYKFGKYESIATSTPESIIATTTSNYDSRILAKPNR